MGYELYEKVLGALKSGDENYFNAAARNWIEGTEEAPFENEEAVNLYANAKHYCSLWRNKAINGRISKQRMIDCVKQIAEMNLPNPYPAFKAFGVIDPEVKVTEEKEEISGWTVKEQATEKPTEKPVEKPVEKTAEKEKKPEHVMGVVPEKKGIFGKHKR